MCTIVGRQYFRNMCMREAGIGVECMVLFSLLACEESFFRTSAHPYQFALQIDGHNSISLV